MTESQWKERSGENLRAAELLGGTVSGGGASATSSSGFWNAATARLYYSLYQAVVAALVKKQLEPKTVGSKHVNSFTHECVTDACRDWIGSMPLKNAFIMAKSLRVKADYDCASPVSQNEFATLKQRIVPMLKTLGVSP